jgi:WD40 repeat protein
MSQNPNPVLTFDGHTSNVTGIAFHIETKWMATSSEDGTVKIWDLRSPNVQRDYSHGSAVNDVVIHPNQGEVISCDQAGCVKVWDLGENANIHTVIPEEDVPTRSVTVANDASMLVAGNNKVFRICICTDGRATFMFGRWRTIEILLRLLPPPNSPLTINILFAVCYRPM